MSKTGNYWLSPTGRVVECDLGRHYERALHIIDEKYRLDAFENGIIDRYGIPDTRKDIIGYLENKGWIRYEGWSKNPTWLIYDRTPTKAQIERMFELTEFYYRRDNE